MMTFLLNSAIPVENHRHLVRAAHRERSVFAGASRLVTCTVAPLKDAIFTINITFDGLLNGNFVVGIPHVFRRDAITGRSVYQGQQVLVETFFHHHLPSF